MCSSNTVRRIAPPLVATSGFFFWIVHGSTTRPCDACGGSCAGAANIRARRGLRGCFVLRCVECCEHLEHGAACSQSTPATLESSELALLRPSEERGRVRVIADLLCDERGGGRNGEPFRGLGHETSLNQLVQIGVSCLSLSTYGYEALWEERCNIAPVAR